MPSESDDRALTMTATPEHPYEGAEQMSERDCTQCGKPVIVGHHHVTGAITNDAGEMELDVELRHYDCLPIALRDTDPYVAGAVAAAESGIRDDALQAHLEGVMTSGS